MIGISPLQRRLAESILLLSLMLTLLFLLIARPPTPFYALPLAPIALAAALHGFAGGTLATLAAMGGVALLIALDPDTTRRATTLQEAWPILLMYLAVGPFLGWLANREHERERRLVWSAQRLHVVQEIGQAIITSLELNQTLETILAETRRLVPFQRAAVLLLEGNTLRVAAASEGDTLQSTVTGEYFQLYGSAAGKAIDQGRIWYSRPEEIARYADTLSLCPNDLACVILPLEFQHRSIGAFFLAGQGLNNPPASELASLQQIAGHIAIAIENARLYESERQWSRHLAAISEACREITASLDLERTLRMVMAKAAETLPMDAGALFQFDKHSSSFRVAVSHDLSPEHEAKITFAFEEGVPGWVIKHRKALIISDATSDERVHPDVVKNGVHSVLATPLIAREKTVGVLALYCRRQPSAFDEEALRLSEVFAAQAAIAIENAYLVEELRRAAAELEVRIEQRTRQLRESQAKMIRTEKLAVVGRLAASVAHEVNNPLQAVSLQLQLLAEEWAVGGAGERLQVVQDELARIAAIVQRLLDFQRPHPGEVSQHRPVDLLEDVLALAEKQLQRAQVTIHREFPLDISPVMAVGDQLKQVFLNLILNAAEAMPEGGHLSIRMKESAETVSVAFTDTGVGMPPDILGQLFEPFFSTKPNGTGLGLAVSHEIITQHGGTLDAFSTPAAGSTFEVRLPAARLATPGSM